MTRVADIVAWMNEFAPESLAEAWDNVGLLWGDPMAEVVSAMTCLTVTSQTAREAIEAGAGLIVSHHPVLFKPVQRLVSEPGRPDSLLWELAKAGVAIHSPHTAFDNCAGGINALLAQRFGMTNMQPIRSLATSRFKVAVFTPEGDRENVLAAAFAAGAGRIGSYRECSFAAQGMGTFYGETGTSPAVGKAGRRESVAEWKLEFVCQSTALALVLEKVRAAHSYEMPAIDVYPLADAVERPSNNPAIGVGRLGLLPSRTSLRSFAKQVGESLKVDTVQVVGALGREVERVAVACGASDDFVAELEGRADVLVMGECRFHTALAAEAIGLALVIAGHHATERPGVEALAESLASAFPAIEIWASESERDPLQFLPTEPIPLSKE
jgi:dinuclear metal center YbgI/SA1388 family protein